MRRFFLGIRLLLLALFTLPATDPQASPVAWNFIVPECTVTASAAPARCRRAHRHPDAAGPMSSGSASWDGFINDPPVYSGDPF
jgi:hypothetical protein